MPLYADADASLSSWYWAIAQPRDAHRASQSSRWRSTPARWPAGSQEIRVLRVGLLGVFAFAVGAVVWAHATSPPVAISLSAGASSGTAAPATMPSTTTVADGSAAKSTAPTAPSKAFCDGLRADLERLQRISISLTDPAVLRPLLDAEAPAIAQSASVATPAATPDVAAVKALIGDLKAGMEAAGYDFAKLPPATALSVQSPGVMASVARLSALLQGGC